MKLSESIRVETAALERKLLESEEEVDWSSSNSKHLQCQLKLLRTAISPCSQELESVRPAQDILDMSLRYDEAGIDRLGLNAN